MDNIFPTSTIGVLFGALTISCTIEAQSIPVEQKALPPIIKIVNTMAIQQDYIDEWYCPTTQNEVDDTNQQLDFWALLQNINLPSKDVDEDILNIMNNLDNLLWKEIPSRSRF